MKLYLAGGVNANLKPLWGGYYSLYQKYKKYGIKPFWSDLCNYISRDANQDTMSLLNSYGGGIEQECKKKRQMKIFLAGQNNKNQILTGAMGGGMRKAHISLNPFITRMI